MGWLFAKFYDAVVRASEDAGVRQWRREMLARLDGDVLELGAGTGLNLPFYPETGIRRLVVTEPDRHMYSRLQQRVLATSRRELEVVRAGAEQLPVADASFDWVVSTLVLCTVPDLHAALAEVRRVLRPGGALLFMEHVAWDDIRRRRWQWYFEPFWKWFANGCRLTRRTIEALEAAGFRIEELAEEVMPKAPPISRRTFRGVARRD